MSVPRPVQGNTAATLASIFALCDAVDAASELLTAVQQAVASAQSAIGAEVTARQQAITGEAQARGNADTQEAQARAQGISGEANARAAAILQEQRDRGTAIAAAVNDFGNRITALSDSLQQALRAETQARAAADQGEQEARVDAIRAQAKALADAASGLEDKIATKADADTLDSAIRTQAKAVSDLQASGAKALADAVAADEKALADAITGQEKALADAIAAVRVVTDAISATLTAQRLDFVAPAGRPGDAPLRYTFVPATAALAGPRAALPFLPPGLLANDDAGPVVRIIGSGILAARAACALEAGRLYRARYVVQRRANPSNPSGDAVVCGNVYLDQSLRVLGDVVPLRTYPALATAFGRQECEVLIARTVGLGAAFQAPPAARFMVPVVATFGPDALTDIEVLAIEDVTGAFVLAPPIADFEARLAALEAGDYGARLQAVESAAGTAGAVQFKSKGDAAFGAIPDSVQVVTLLGRQFAGDGGGGRYVRAAAGVAASADSFTSHGAVFNREVVSADVVAGMLESGFETWVGGLPTEPPPQSGKRWNDHGVPAVTP